MQVQEEKPSTEQPVLLAKQRCPFCKADTMVLTEVERDIPYFGRTYLFSMSCDTCKYHKADLEAIEKKEPSRYTVEVTTEEDMKIRIVRSSEATIKIPHVITITPGPAANGYVTNVEGILNRVKHQIEVARDSEDDDDEAKKKAKSLLKKLNRVVWGQEKLKLIIEDPTGNSAIISEKAVKEKLK
ncbi:MAG: ZPR1 zinc finger domain-containing protein [Nanoarchaeota archaeon]